MWLISRYVTVCNAMTVLLVLTEQTHIKITICEYMNW